MQLLFLFAHLLVYHLKCQNYKGDGTAEEQAAGTWHSFSGSAKALILFSEADAVHSHCNQILICSKSSILSVL